MNISSLCYSTSKVRLSVIVKKLATRIGKKISIEHTNNPRQWMSEGFFVLVAFAKYVSHPPMEISST